MVPSADLVDAALSSRFAYVYITLVSRVSDIHTFIVNFSWSGTTHFHIMEFLNSLTALNVDKQRNKTEVFLSLNLCRQNSNISHDKAHVILIYITSSISTEIAYSESLKRKSVTLVITIVHNRRAEQMKCYPSIIAIIKLKLHETSATVVITNKWTPRLPERPVESLSAPLLLLPLLHLWQPQPQPLVVILPKRQILCASSCFCCRTKDTVPEQDNLATTRKRWLF